MSALKGYPNQTKDERYSAEFTTVEPVRVRQHALSVLAHVFMSDVAADLVEAGSTSFEIMATSHEAKRGDVIAFTSGPLSGLEFKVWKGSEDSEYTNKILIAEEMPAVPVTGNAFDILRHRYPKVSDLGAASVTLAPQDIVDFLDDELLETSVNNIPASSSAPLTVVASLAQSVTKVRVADTTGSWIGVYSDPQGTPQLLFIINPGADSEFEVSIPASSEVGVRNMADEVINVGQLCMQFMA